MKDGSQNHDNLSNQASTSSNANHGNANDATRRHGRWIAQFIGYNPPSNDTFCQEQQATRQCNNMAKVMESENETVDWI